MDQGLLVGPSLEAGRSFVELLESSGIPVTAALWQWDGFLGRDKWELDVASPLVDEIGLQKTYRRIIDVMSKAGTPPDIDLLRVNLFTPKAAFIKSLRREYKGRRDVPLSANFVGDHEIEHGYLYFVK